MTEEEKRDVEYWKREYERVTVENSVLRRMYLTLTGCQADLSDIFNSVEYKEMMRRTKKLVKSSVAELAKTRVAE